MGYRSRIIKQLFLAAGLGLLTQGLGVAQILNSGLPVAGPLSESTVTITQNGAGSAVYPSAPLTFTGNTNGYLQMVGQNQSNGNNASSDYVLTDDLGGDTSFYLDLGINSSQFSQVSQSVEPSSSAYLVTSDSPLVIWAGTNGGQYTSTAAYIVFGTSLPVTSNTRMSIFTSSVTFNSVSTVNAYAVAISSVNNSTTTFSIMGNGHLDAGGVNHPTLSSCGTGPVLTPGSNDVRGALTTGATSGTSCTVTFGAPFVSAPICLVVDRTGGLTSPAWTVTNSALSMTSLTSSDNYSYLCLGQ